MQHVLNSGKRVFSAVIAAATIAFSVGAGALVAPQQVSAASAGDLIKGTSLSTVYYYGYDGMRYTFPNEKTYMTWFSDFSDVVTISDSALSDITLGGNVVVRPGTYWVKIQSDPKVYAVARNGMIHWIESEEVAVDFAGSDWAQRVIDVPDVFFPDYEVGTSLMEAAAYEGSLYEMGGDTYLVWDGEMRLVTDDGMDDNNFMSKFVLDGSGIDDSSLTMGDDVDGSMLALSDVAQTEDGESSATGDIEISEASSMPAGKTLTGGANSVPVFSFEVEAGSEDAVLDDLALSMIGAGSTSNLSAVYLYEGNTRLSEARTVNASTRQVTFSNLDLEIAEGDSVTLTVRVTVSTSQVAADTFGFKIADADSVVASGEVDGSFPIEGNTFTLSGSDSGTVTITKTGTIADPNLGQQDAEIGQFKVSASGSEAGDLNMLTLKIDDAADHADFNLWDGDTWIAEGVNTTGDYVLFDLSADQFEIEEGGNNIFAVTADIGGQDADTVKVFIDNAIDIEVIGGDYGFGMAVDIDGTGATPDTGYDGTSCTASTGECSFSTVQGGEVTIAFNGPTAGDVQVDGQDQELLAFSITAAQEVTIKDLDFIVAADDDNDGDTTDGVETGDADDDGLINSGSEANLKDIKVVNADTGAVVWASLELDTTTDDASSETSLTGTAEDALQIIDFTDDETIDAGETWNLVLTADIDNTLTSGEEISASLDISGLSIEDENGDALASTDIVPGSDIQGYEQTARSATLTFARASTPISQTVVDGADNVNVVSFAVTAGLGSDTTITDFTLTAYGDDDGSGTSTIGGSTASDINDYVESCSLYDGTVLLDGPEAPASNGQTIRFPDINWDIAEGATDTLAVHCNFANTSTSGSAYFTFDINDVTTDVVAEDEDGDQLATASLTGSDVNGATTLASARIVTLADSGSLAVTAGAQQPQVGFLLTSTADQYVSNYRITATNESFLVQTLTFTEEQGPDDDVDNDDGASAAALNDEGYANNISSVKITYPLQDGTTGSQTATMSANEVNFQNLNLFVSPAASADVKVYVSVPLTDRESGGSATSNEKVRMSFSDGDNSGSDDFKAVGIGSGTTLAEDATGVVDIGDDASGTDSIVTFVVKETKPVVSISTSTPTGSGFIPGLGEVYRFNVQATGNEDVSLERLVFKMYTTDLAGDGTADWNECDTDNPAGVTTPTDFTFYNLTVDGTSVSLDNSTSATHNTTVGEMAASTNNPWTFLTSTAALCTSTAADIGFVALDLPAGELIPKGSTYTFALYFDSTGASAGSDDSLRFSIVQDPIVSSFLLADADGLATNNVTPIATTFDVEAGTGATTYAPGDILCLDTDNGDSCGATEERVLVASISTDTLTVVRGYLNSIPDSTEANDVDDSIYRMPGSLLWKDDGVVTVAGTSDDWWGSYITILGEVTPTTNGSIQF